MKKLKLFKNKNFTIGFILVMLLILLTAVSLIYTPYSPTKIDANAQTVAPSLQHLCGTDRLGRDVLSRTMVAGKTAFKISLISVTASLILGVVLGLVAGFYQGVLGNIIMRLTDAFKAIPGLLFAMMIAAVFGKSFVATTIAISIILIPTFVRITRASVLKIKSNEYIQWTSLIGLKSFRVMIVHILPNIISPIIITASMGFADAVLIEASLSYLGLGIQPPNPSWGQMLSEGQGYFMTAPWLVIFPGLMITMLVLGFNLLGDGLSDLLDARSNNREV
ncbi:ABC transporter permease [Sedimentibacter sp. zth1]|uniref:ABC transporter permease n=1 Tax=Sedimentibacter sp. zth1 TaxID=2816908 RepID=UPI001A930CEC|nr:ABC transporter permease [Sedimentibacter sp. zth1]QSX05360.1 ABC transporter permease [Sedimentibacter sp. zth1]